MSDDNSFNSIEKMMEFGMSMAVAQQMMQTMNHAMQNMTTPQFQQVNVPMPANSVQFYALVNDIPQGPFSEKELSSHILANRVTKETLVWIYGMSGWMQAGHVIEVAKLFAMMPPPIK
jgi:hypothetical protein